ncbi:MAG: FAD-binding oxidoreductase [Crocinitomicaceae bacterium]
MTLKDRTYIIVGGGLAGVSVSIQLIQAGAQVILFDKNENHSSIIAAGIINPIVFRRMTKSWRVDEFLPYLKSFYNEMELETGSTFLYELPMRRMFSSLQEHDFWLEKQENIEFQPYLNPVTQEDMNYTVSKNEFGSGRVSAAYYVDVKTFIQKCKAWVSTKGEVIQEEFNYDQLNENSYKDITFDDIIFCEGFENKNNPWFGELPLDQTKGQTLTVRSTELPIGVSLNRKCFVLPLEKNLFKVGSTYEWHNPTTHITEEAKTEILDHLSFITDEKVEVISQEAGVRPTTRDRRPLIGTHPHHKNFHIFNGLGAKGYMICPMLSHEFVSYLAQETSLDKEVDVKRYFTKD